MKIIHINQQHKVGYNLISPPELIERTVRSQFQVAQELKKYPGCPIVEESLYEDALDASSLPMSKVAKTIFPKGFPRNFADLTPIQKDILYNFGAAFTLFFIGEIPRIYRAINKEASDTIDKSILEGNYDQMFSPREIEAIDCAKKAAMSQFGTLENSTVIIVFGAGHNFKPYCDKEGFEYELINTVQQTRALEPVIITPLPPVHSIGLDAFASCQSLATDSLFLNQNLDELSDDNDEYLADLDEVSDDNDEYPADCVASVCVLSPVHSIDIHAFASYQSFKIDQGLFGDNDKYPTNEMAAEGLNNCSRDLEPQNYFSNNSHKRQIGFFAPVPTTISAMNSGLEDYLASDLVRMDFD